MLRASTVSGAGEVFSVVRPEMSKEMERKVQFYKDIKDYERRLNDQAVRDDIALHSYIISQTPFLQLRGQVGIPAIPGFNRLHIYFREQDNYAELLLSSILTDRES